MGNIAIQAEGLGKLYRLGKREKYRTLRDTVANALSAPARLLRPAKREVEAERFWALKEVSLDIRHGDVVGVIGRNGAGKSTLLKILARITEPTKGEAKIFGRIASLLEVGTGFHPELTGRENVFLNGAILGMKKAEIRSKFDEIVAFAEVEQFIDTPVKHYSSGMYVRLAFAVAAHLEPEILVIDEVLAVGDQQFQTKCLNKMSEVGKSGRTILFVSHSMAAIQRLCQRVVVLGDGVVKADGDAMTGITEYLNTDVGPDYVAPGISSQPYITRANLFAVSNRLHLSVDFESPFALNPPVLGFLLYDSLGNPVFGTNSKLERPAHWPSRASSGHLEVAIPTDNLRTGKYSASLWLGDHYTDYCHLDKMLRIDYDRHDAKGPLPPAGFGHFYIPTKWSFDGECVEPAGTRVLDAPVKR